MSAKARFHCSGSGTLLYVPYIANIAAAAAAAAAEERRRAYIISASRPFRISIQPSQRVSLFVRPPPRQRTRRVCRARARLRIHVVCVCVCGVFWAAQFGDGISASQSVRRRFRCACGWNVCACVQQNIDDRLRGQLTDHRSSARPQRAASFHPKILRDSARALSDLSAIFM